VDAMMILAHAATAMIAKMKRDACIVHTRKPQAALARNDTTPAPIIRERWSLIVSRGT